MPSPVRYCKCSGLWKDVAPRLCDKYGIGRQTRLVMDRTVPLVERELFAQGIEDTGFPSKTKTIHIPEDYTLLPGTSVLAQSISIHHEESNDPFCLFRYALQNIERGSVGKERIQASYRNKINGIGSLESVVRECGDGPGLFGFYMHYEGNLVLSIGLPEDVFRNPDTGKALWETLRESDPRNGSNFSMFFRFISAIKTPEA